MSQRRGFTLVELLVVVSIIALLIAILLPALNKARKAAVAAVCGSNMRQVFLAESTYATDSEGYIGFMYSWNGAPDLSEWEGFLLGKCPGASFAGIPDYTLSPYLLAPKVLACPGALPKTFTQGSNYGINLDALDLLHLYFNTPVHAMTYKPQVYFVPGKAVKPITGNSWTIVFANFYQAVAPSTGVLITDSIMPYNGEIQVDTVSLFGPIQGGPPWERAIHLRHGQAANVLFWDGHVELASTGRFAEMGAVSVRGENMEVLLAP